MSYLYQIFCLDVLSLQRLFCLKKSIVKNRAIDFFLLFDSDYKKKFMRNGCKYHYAFFLKHFCQNLKQFMFKYRALFLSKIAIFY